jgi:hypothetical protein
VRRLAMLTVATVGLAGLTGLAPGAVASGEGAAVVQVVADGLNAPRGLVYDRGRDRVLVAEAGIGLQNTGPCGYAERGLYMCLGHTGSVYQHSTSGAPGRRIVTGLPSTAIQALPDVVIGLHDLSLRDGRLTAVFGLLGNKPYRESLGAGAAAMGQAGTIDGTGQVRPFADVVSFEDGINPGVEADPFGVITGPFGTVIANAGGPNTTQGNDLLLARPDGTITRLAQFPERPSVTDPNVRIRAVPTSVVQGPDGAFYVGELTGTPFFAGEARVWRVRPGQPPTVYADGFTTIVDLAFDDRGRLVVLQTGNDPFDTEQEGAIIRVDRHGNRTVLASAGLPNPGGMAMAGDGVFYVTSRMASGGGVGRLLKVRTSG